MTQNNNPELYRLHVPVPEGLGEAPTIRVPLITMIDIYHRVHYWKGHRKNIYTCGDCHAIIVTVDVHPGVTPIFLPCPDKACKKIAVTHNYPPTIETMPNLPEPSIEWYRPNARQLAKMQGAAYDHIVRGGLVRREVRHDGE